MRTSKPFSTISYNTPDYLTAKLDELITMRKIEFYAFIEHLPEDDETKFHKHLLIIPNGSINTDQLQDHLTELDPEKPDKPLGCIMCRPSKFGDWYLYVLHDKGYLAQKGQTRTYHYKPDEITVSDKDYFNELCHTIDYTPYTRFTQIRQFAEDGIAFADLVHMGLIPPQQVYAYEKTYNMLLQHNGTFRNGRDGHDDEEAETDGAQVNELPRRAVRKNENGTPRRHKGTRTEADTKSATSSSTICPPP